LELFSGLSDISENKTSEDEGAHVEKNNNNNKAVSKIKSANSDSSDGEEVAAYQGDIFEMKSSTTTGSDEEKEGRGMSTPELQTKMHSSVQQFREMHDKTVDEILALNQIKLDVIQPEKCNLYLTIKL